MPRQVKKTRRKKRASPEAIAERKHYARIYFTAAASRFAEGTHDELDIGMLMNLRQLKSGDLSDKPRIEVCAALCALLHLSNLFPEQEQIRETVRLAYLALAFAKKVVDECGPEKLQALPGIFEPLDFAVELYCQAHKLVSPRELISALHKAQQDLGPVFSLVREKFCSLVLPKSAEDEALPAIEDPAMVSRRGVAWIHDAPTPGCYREDERGYAWISDAGARIQIDKATPVVWEGEKK